ncbi:hypothetical protein J5N97_025301 [Dioscorea zingiberensis]|uniref:Uncharacterized protein n=1 Tax=Dioscorea zingiberensis TaxID=325984 RepID=A0A9D5C922_9LILI|nr:hypothetical protein J5N97_025301 [Dioscorea zingiberensis]
MSGCAWTEEMHASFLNWMEESFVLNLRGLTAPEHERCAYCSAASTPVSHPPAPGELGNAYRIRNWRRKRLATPSDEPQDQVVPQLGNNGMKAKDWEMQRKRSST